MHKRGFQDEGGWNNPRQHKEDIYDKIKTHRQEVLYFFKQGRQQLECFAGVDSERRNSVKIWTKVWKVRELRFTYRAHITPTRSQHSENKQALELEPQT